MRARSVDFIAERRGSGCSGSTQVPGFHQRDLAVTMPPDLLRRLVLARRPRKLPEVLSVEEVGRLLEAAPGIKCRAALGVAYGAGLRVLGRDTWHLFCQRCGRYPEDLTDI